MSQLAVGSVGRSVLDERVMALAQPAATVQAADQARFAQALASAQAARGVEAAAKAGAATAKTGVTTVKTVKAADSPPGQRVLASLQTGASMAAVTAATTGAAATGAATQAKAVADIPAATAGTVTVSNGAELAKALASAVPGQHIVLKDGTYATAGGFTVKASGLAGAPVVIEAEHALGARITGSLTLAGHDQIASGLYLDGANVAINGDRSRLTGAKITGTDGIAVLIGKGADVRVDHCELTGMDGRGISIKPDPANPGALVRPRIDHNWLHDFVGPQGENVHEPIQIGQTRSQSNISVQAVVEDNLLERVNVDNEAISIKSSDNIVRNNTLRDSVAFICNRHGERNEISGNLLDNTRGIVVLDRGTVVSNNKVVNSPGYGIKVMAGTHDATSTDHGYPAAVDTVLSNNQVDKVVIGYAWDGSTVACTGTVIQGSQGCAPTVTNLAQGTAQLSAAGQVIGHVLGQTGEVGTGSTAVDRPTPPQSSGTTTPGERVLSSMGRKGAGSGAGTGADGGDGAAAPTDLAQLAAMLIANMNMLLQQWNDRRDDRV